MYIQIINLIMKTKIIGFDLDDTLVKTDIIRLASEKFGYTKYSDLTKRDWRFTNFPEDLRKEIFRMYASPKYMSYLANPIDGARELMKELKKQGFTIYIITARVSRLKRSSKNLVKKLFPEVDSVYFVDILETKKELFKKLKLDFWVDDAPHEIKNALTLGIKSFMISNKNTNYNWNMKKAAGLKSIKSVKELKLKDFSNG